MGSRIVLITILLLTLISNTQALPTILFVIPMTLITIALFSVTEFVWLQKLWEESEESDADREVRTADHSDSSSSRSFYNSVDTHTCVTLC